MSGTVVYRVSRDRHLCMPPTWWERHRLNIDFGSVWRCDCGRYWQWQAPGAEPIWVEISEAEASKLARREQEGGQG